MLSNQIAVNLLTHDNMNDHNFGSVHVLFPAQGVNQLWNKLFSTWQKDAARDQLWNTVEHLAGKETDIPLRKW